MLAKSVRGAVVAADTIVSAKYNLVSVPENVLDHPETDTHLITEIIVFIDLNWSLLMMYYFLVRTQSRNLVWRPHYISACLEDWRVTWRA